MMRKVAIYGMDDHYTEILKSALIEFEVVCFIKDETGPKDMMQLHSISIIDIGEFREIYLAGSIDGVVIPRQLFGDEIIYDKFCNKEIVVKNIYVADRNMEEDTYNFTSFQWENKRGIDLYYIKEEPLVTIYTQAFNSEKYIAECMESVINQAYSNWEYIVCNHGSSDCTFDIMKQYAAKDSRIRIVEKPNSLRGFIPDMINEMGKGKYFAMIDGDDFVHKDYIRRLVSYAEINELDMASCSVLTFDDIKNIKVLRKSEQPYKYDISQNDKFFAMTFPFLRTIWGKIIRMNVLRQADYSTYRINAIDYVSEDTAFALANYEKCKRIGVIPEYLLYYRITPGSVSSSYNKKMVDNSINIYYQAKQIMKNIGDNSETTKECIRFIYGAALADAAYKMQITKTPVDFAVSEIERILSMDLTKEFIENGYDFGSAFERIFKNYIEELKCSFKKMDLATQEKFEKILSVLRKVLKYT